MIWKDSNDYPGTMTKNVTIPNDNQVVLVRRKNNGINGDHRI